MLSESNETYLITIYRLTRTRDIASTKDIATRLNVSLPSVTEQLKRLSERGYACYKWREGATLTAKGEQVALKILRNHRLLKTLLVEVVGYGLDEVFEEACCLENQISETLATRLEAALGHPKTDPHGQPIPSETGHLPATRDRPLSEAAVGATLVVSAISDDEATALRYLLKRGIAPGATITLLDKVPNDGPLVVEVNQKSVAITNLLAKEVRVFDAEEST